MKKSILIFTSEFPPQPGGIGNHAFNLAKSLSNLGYKITVLADQRSRDGQAESEFDNKLKFKVKRTAIRRFRPLMYVSRIISYLKLSEEAELVIASGKFSLWMVGLLGATKYNNKIAVIHGTEVNLSGKMSNYLVQKSLSKFKSLIAVSNYTKNLLSNTFQEKTVVIPNGFNNDLWPLKETPKSYSGKLVLITIGNVNYRKGQQNVINKIPVLKKKYPNLEYHCIGVPTKQNELESLASDLDINNSVYFHGILDHESLLERVLSSDIVVMLSTPSTKGDVEGFGIAIIEANSQGLPAIGSNNCGIEDAIDHNNSGLLINYKDTEAFCLAIDKIISNYKHYSKDALKWAEEHTWQKIVRRYVKAIEQ